jgi:iron complex outermembrane receptor protein
MIRSIFFNHLGENKVINKNRIWLPAVFLCFVHLLYGADPVDLTEIPIEDLMRIEVTIASRHSERMTDAAAAIYVLTRDEIVESGYTSIPEILRMIPGMEVGRMDANKWAVTVRGFNNLFSNKLLILMDGRTIYNPIFSGVVWDAQDVVIEDIEQIEVVRGPGGAMWGANAVNGVINIVTRSSKDTKGAFFTLGGGTEERGFGVFRYGGSMKNMDYRIYMKYFNRSDLVDKTGETMSDHWDMWKTGIRMDGKPTSKDQWTVLSEYYKNDVGQTLYSENENYIYTQDFRNQDFGGYLLGRWDHEGSNQDQWKIQAYLDAFKRHESLMISGQIYTLDIDMQYNRAFQSHTMTIGGGVREIQDSFNNTSYIQILPQKKNYSILNAFIQDNISFLDHRCHMIFGSKFEYHSLSGLEIQPNVRVAYDLNREGLLWVSISRAVRTPARIDLDMTSGYVVGNPDLKSEELLAFEIGGRTRPVKNVFLDISSYYNYYNGLLTYEPMVAMNNKNEYVAGLELALDVQASPWIRLRSGGSFGDCRIKLDKTSQDPYNSNQDREMPRYQYFTQAIMQFHHRWKWTVNIRYVDTLKGESMYTHSYYNLDSRVAYKPSENLEFSIVGQNLLEKRHAEFNAEWIPLAIAEVPRGFYIQWKWWFLGKN